MNRIEKSGFRKGEYVGYGFNKVWKITRRVGGWYAYATNQFLSARTLKELNSLLDGYDSSSTLTGSL